MFILQRASYHYVNVQAQFQIFNEKNWFYMEDGLRDFVIKSGKDYTVYTGSHGVMELDDINNNKVEIYLNLERADLARLPAPRYAIRVVFIFQKIRQTIRRVGCSISVRSNPAVFNWCACTMNLTRCHRIWKLVDFLSYFEKQSTLD